MGLYAIVDVEVLAVRGIDIVPFVEAVLCARPALLQLRAKGLGAAATLDWLRRLAPLARAAGVPLFANDRPDLAVLAGCDGVHLGQDDVPISVARAVARASGRRIAVGLSTHDANQVDLGAALDVDYLAIGPVFPTENKRNAAAALGATGLAVLAASARAVRPSMPLVAIGAIDAESAEAVARVVDHVAVIGALLPERATPDALAEVRGRAERLVGLAARGEGARASRPGVAVGRASRERAGC